MSTLLSLMSSHNLHVKEHNSLEIQLNGFSETLPGFNLSCGEMAKAEIALICNNISNGGIVHMKSKHICIKKPALTHGNNHLTQQIVKIWNIMPEKLVGPAFRAAF